MTGWEYDIILDTLEQTFLINNRVQKKDIVDYIFKSYPKIGLSYDQINRIVGRELRRMVKNAELINIMKGVYVKI